MDCEPLGEPVTKLPAHARDTLAVLVDTTTFATSDLDDRIAAAFSDGVKLEDVKALIAEAEAASASVSALHTDVTGTLRFSALSPTLSYFAQPDGDEGRGMPG